MKPILSICMIVKNEEKVLKRCLESLKPLMKEISSELIITDTGSTDGTVGIAKEYADQILYFEWIADFSAARNIGIKKARGEWLLIMDADMWFLDIKGIVDFFKSGEYKNYTNAFITSRNYTVSGNRDIYTDSKPQLMFKMFEDIHYEGKIHEQLRPMRGNAAMLDVICHHSGYAYEDGSDQWKIKHERNLTPLLADYEKNPDDRKTLYHLIKEFVANDEILQAADYIEKGFSMVKDNPEDDLYSMMYKFKCYLKRAEEDSIGVIDMVNKYLENRPTQNIVDLDFYVIKAKAFQAMEKYQEAISIYDEYFELFTLMQAGKLSKDISTLESCYSNTEAYSNIVLLDKVICFVMMEKYEAAIEVLNQIAMEKLAFNNIEVLISASFLCAEKNRNYNGLLPIYNKLEHLKNEAYIEKFIEIGENYLKKNPEELKDFSASLRNSDKGLDTIDLYLQLQNLRYLDAVGDRAGAKEVLGRFLHENISFENPYCDLLFYGFKYFVDIEALYDKINYNTLSFNAGEIAGKHVDLMQVLEDFMKEEVGQKENIPVRTLFIIGVLCEQILIHSSKDEGGMNGKKFEIYTGVMKNCLEKIYAPSTLTDENIAIIPKAYRFAYYAVKALRAKEGADSIGYSYYLKEGSKCYPAMGDIVNRLIKEQ